MFKFKMAILGNRLVNLYIDHRQRCSCSTSINEYIIPLTQTVSYQLLRALSNHSRKNTVILRKTTKRSRAKPCRPSSPVCMITRLPYFCSQQTGVPLSPAASQKSFFQGIPIYAFLYKTELKSSESTIQLSNNALTNRSASYYENRTPLLAKRSIRMPTRMSVLTPIIHTC